MRALCGACFFASCALVVAHSRCNDAAKCTVEDDENTTSTSALVMRKTLGSWTEAKRAAIVSASYGGRAAASVLPRCPRDMRCVLYTDTQIAEDGGWLVSTEPYHANSDKYGPGLNSGGRHSWGKITNEKVRNVMAAKFYKMNMFLLPELVGINVILWHDAEWVVHWFYPEVSLADRLCELVQGFPMVVGRHYDDRNTVSAEMEPAADRARGNTGYQLVDDEIHEAYEHQKQLGFTDDALYNGANFLIDSNWPQVRSAFLGWWHEVQDFTFRDQISLPFIVQHFNLSVRVLDPRYFHSVILGTADE